MANREHCQKVFESEVQRWSALTYDELAAKLIDVVAYEVEADSQICQVEVQLLENTRQYVHVMVSVDDGSLRGAFRPLSHSFIVHKQ